MKFPPLLRCMAVLLALGLGSIARADNVTLVGTDGVKAGGQYVYPYYFSLNGSSDLTKMMCLSLDRAVSLNESWETSRSLVPLDNDPYSISLRADAYMLSQAGQYSTVDLQYAIWSIFDPTDAMNSSAWTSTAADLANMAKQKANDAMLTYSGFYADYVIFTPTADQTGWTRGEPQILMTTLQDLGPTIGPLAPPQADTPEPNSLALLLTGMAASGAVFLARRRGSAVAQMA